MSKKRRPQGYKVKPAAAQETGNENPPSASAASNPASGVQTAAPAGKTSGATTAEPGTQTPANARAEELTSDSTGADSSLELVEEAEPAYDLPKWEHSLIDVEPVPVSEKDLRNLIRDWRHGRATKTLRQVLADGYVMVFAAAIIVAMLGGAVWRGQAQASQCISQVCTVGRSLLPWVTMAGAFCLTAMASRIFGPVVASAAEGFWLMDAPIRRGRLLWKRLVGVVVVVALIGAVLGGLLAALTGYGIDDIWRWAIAVGIGAAGLTALAAAEQTWGRTWVITLIQWIFAIVAIAVLFLIVSIAAGWFGLSVPVPETSSVIWVSLAGAVLLIGAGAIALSRLGMIHRARLVSGGSLVAGMQGAAFAMDFGLMRDILVERDSTAKGHVRPARGRGTASRALIWREFQRLWRYPKRILLVVISVVVPYAVAALGLHTFSPFISSVVLLIGFVPMLNSMRVMTRTKGLARTLPLSNPQIRQAMAAVPAIFAVAWALGTTLAFWGIEEHYTPTLFQGFITAALTAAAGLLGAIRWVSAKPANYNIPMMQTGFGAMPPGLMLNLIRGFDVVILITGPLLMGWAWYISGIIAVIVAFALSGSYSMEEMQAMQNQMQKERAKSGGGPGTGGLAAMMAARNPAPAPKQKIAPPRGYRTPPVTK